MFVLLEQDLSHFAEAQVIIKDLQQAITQKKLVRENVFKINPEWEQLSYKHWQQQEARCWIHGKHLVPHDAAVHEYSTGLSRVEVARNHGVIFTVVPDIGVIEGIDAFRNILIRSWFDEEKCSKGVTSLENYCKEWNEQHGCWSSHPLHNFASHGADAFRMLAVGLGKLGNKGLTAVEWRQMRSAYI